MKMNTSKLIALSLAGMLCIGSIPVYGGEYEENLPAPNPIEAAADGVENTNSDELLPDTDISIAQDTDSSAVQSVDDTFVQNVEAPTEQYPDASTEQNADAPTIQDTPTVDESTLSTPEENSENPESANIYSNEAQNPDAIDQRIELGSYTINDTMIVEQDLNSDEPLIGAGSRPDPIILSEDAIKYGGGDGRSQIIPYAPNGGIYFLNDNILSFYSLEKKTINKAYTFKTQYDTSFYCTDSAVYQIYKTAYEGSSYVIKYDLATKKKQSETQLALPEKASIYALGVDASNRIYVAAYISDTDSSGGYRIYLFNSKGKLLSQTSCESTVYSFAGFDSVSGKFYYEGYTNWVYWGYEHDMHAMFAGQVTNNKVSVTNEYLFLASQNYYVQHQGSGAMFAGRYFIGQSITYGNVQVFDSPSLNFSSDSLDSIMSLARAGVESEDREAFDIWSMGVRAYVNVDRNSLIIYMNDNTICEYSLADGTMISSAKTPHPVFYMYPYGDGLAAVEFENDIYYLEIIPWKDATSLTIRADKTTLDPGQSAMITAETDSANDIVTFQSSDSKVASVTATGKVTAFHEGSCVITAKTRGGVSRTIRFRVNAYTNPDDPLLFIRTGGIKNTQLQNMSLNSYPTWSSTVKSYLYEYNNLLYRVEATAKTVLVEKYDLSGKAQGSSSYNMELPVFGGFFSGKSHNYLVFGQENLKESNSVEVIRVVKYDKNWKRLAAVSIKGANTFIPFEAGSLRMTETGGKLYIHTCHEMYDEDNSGYNHQANMTFVIKQSTMKVVDQYYDVMNIAQAGYVSHSFNQFVKTDGSKVYRVDQGDAYPRGVFMTSCDVTGDVEDVDYVCAFAYNTLKDSGGNYTGVSVGGFELSEENCLLVGNEDTEEYSYKRNAFVSITKKDMLQQNIVWLTKYKPNASRNAATPNLTKINDDMYLVMWEEYNNNNAFVTTKAVLIDSEGHITSDVVESDILRLSDCQPIICSDGFVRWYVTDGGTPILYTLDPYAMKSRKEFSDVKDKKHAYYTAIYWASQYGITKGYPDGTFGINRSCTRGEMMMFLWRYAGKPAPKAVTKSPFKDVAKTHVFYNAILWGSQEGITKGYPDGTFGINRNVSRGECMMFLWRLKGTPAPKAVAKSPFTDVSKTHAFYNAILWGSQNKVTTGYTSGAKKGTFGINENCTRGAIVTFLYRAK